MHLFFQKIFVFKNILLNYVKLSKIKNRYYKLISLPFGLIFSFVLVNLLQILCLKKLILYLIKKLNLYFSIRYLNLKNKIFVSENLPELNSSVKYKLDNVSKNKLKFLKKNGYLYLGKIFSKNDCKNFIKNLENKYYFNSQQPLQSNGELYKFRLKSKINYDYLTFLPSSFLTKNILSKTLEQKKIITSYLNFEPKIYSALTWINFPSNKKHYVHNLHRDYDDFKFLVLAIYWNDVAKKNGATTYIPKSHRSLKKCKIKYLTGKAGSAFLIDSYGLHSGTKLSKEKRFSTWIRFGREINAASIQDGMITSYKY